METRQEAEVDEFHCTAESYGYADHTGESVVSSLILALGPILAARSASFINHENSRDLLD